MIKNTNRRDFVKSTAAIGIGFWAAGGVSAKVSTSSLEKIQFGCIGVDGKGRSDSADADKFGKVVAICDIDKVKLDDGKKRMPDAKEFFDYREMLENMSDKIDAVTVSTPDHTHAVAAVAAMKLGKHCFCQKPLTHSIEEARMMGNLAKEKGVVTQMGNQGTALDNLRQSAALIQAGVIGTVKEVHIWTDRPVWPQGDDVQIIEKDAPEHIKWDYWIGPAKMRPYSPEIHPFKWRGYWAYGTGALGDMACHTLNMSYMALGLKNPTSVVAETSGHNKIVYPKWSQIVFEFPEMDGRAALKMYWYDGGKRPPAKLLEGCPRGEGNRPFASGALVVGEKGNFFSPGDYGGENRSTGTVVDGKFTNQRNVEMKAEFEESPGHFEEFTNAIAGTGTPRSNFPEYSGPLTETILLGNLAVWADGQKIVWDAENLKIKENSNEELESIVRHSYHNGYSL
jgi:predicted dehydrogenase